jgi:hypothetical protein
MHFLLGMVAQWYSSGLRAGWSWGSNPGRGWEFFSSPPRPNRFWGPPSLLSSGYQGFFPGGKAAGTWSWSLTSIYYQGQRMSGAILPLPQYAFMAWCSVKAQGQLYLLHLLGACRHSAFILSIVIILNICAFFKFVGSFISRTNFY